MSVAKGIYSNKISIRLLIVYKLRHSTCALESLIFVPFKESQLTWWPYLQWAAISGVRYHVISIWMGKRRNFKNCFGYKTHSYLWAGTYSAILRDLSPI